MVDSECVFTPVINEDSGEQTSPANTNIETKIIPCSTQNGINIPGCDDLKKNDSDLAIEVVDLDVLRTFLRIL